MHKKHQDHQRVGTWLCRAMALFMAIGFTTAWAHVAIQADTVLIHGHITTMDPANPQVRPWPCAMDGFWPWAGTPR